MGKIFKFIKRYWLLILIVLIVILYILNKVLETREPASLLPTPATDKVASFREITPGSTNIDKVNELLGFPKAVENIDGRDIYEYETSNQYINHQVVSENGIVKHIKEAINIEDNKNVDSVKQTYGAPLYILYEQAPYSVFNLYVYPENGIAYLGHEDGTLLEIWYFEPTSIDNFISSWAKNYSQEKFEGQSQY